MDSRMVKKLFISLVRPILEYGNCVRSPRFKLDMKKKKKNEQVQRRATKLVSELKHLPYEQRHLRLPSLYHRQKRGNMIQTFKIIKGIDRIDTSNCFEFSRSFTRGHKYKLQKKSCRLDVRKYFFSNRVVNDWNSLPNNVVDSETVNQFKDRLDGHWKKHMYENVQPFHSQRHKFAVLYNKDCVYRHLAFRPVATVSRYMFHESGHE